MKANVYIVLARAEGEEFGVTEVTFDKKIALEKAKNSIKILIEDSWNIENIDLNVTYKNLEKHDEVYEDGAGEVQIIERVIEVPKEVEWLD